MINCDLQSIRSKSQELARGCRLSFYSLFAAEISHSRENFFQNPLLSRLREDVLPFIQTGFGHGIAHCKTVSIEAGALCMIEGKDMDNRECRRLTLLSQCAGLLHDICRLDTNHAKKGAELSKKILREYPFEPEEIERIAFAVYNHEAFQTPASPPDYCSALVSNCLYDADKFRWGPDNFDTTLWEICDFNEWDVNNLVQIFPQGLEKIKEIKETFRTNTGRIHGPKFIDCGLDIGREVYHMLLKTQSRN